MLRRVLLADSELEPIRLLSRALRQRGYQVLFATDGAKALEVAILRHPDLILLDAAMPLLDAAAFVNILKTNPRTEAIPVILTSRSLDPDLARLSREGLLTKPFNVDEVLARIGQVFRRHQAARELQGAGKDIEGSLAQLALPDLLQVLAGNKRSGRLTLQRGAERGEIHVSQGRPSQARVGAVEGEKALFRLLGWREGTFGFEPNVPLARPRLERSMEEALLEGLRQADELEVLLARLPPRTARLVLAPAAELSADQHPVTDQVIRLLATPRTYVELLDLVTAPDLDVVRVVLTLLDKGVAQVHDTPADDSAEPLLSPAEVHGLRARLFRHVPSGRRAVGKVFWGARAGEPVRALLSGLAGLSWVSAEPAALTSGFGTLAALPIGEGFRLDLCLLPQQEGARPLWAPFARGAVGAVLVDDSEGALALAQFIAFEARLPVVTTGAALPERLRSAPGGALVGSSDPRACLRTLLVRAAQRTSAQGAAPESLDTQ